MKNTIREETETRKMSRLKLIHSLENWGNLRRRVLCFWHQFWSSNLSQNKSKMFASNFGMCFNTLHSRCEIPHRNQIKGKDNNNDRVPKKSLSPLSYLLAMVAEPLPSPQVWRRKKPNSFFTLFSIVYCVQFGWIAEIIYILYIFSFDFW